jgi:hypothetical protein
VVGAVLRGYFLSGGIDLTGDAGGRYLPAALEITAASGRARPVLAAEDIEYNPLYPHFLAAMNAVDSTLAAAVAVQVLLELGVAGLAFLTARELGDGRSARWALLLAWLCPFLASFTPRLLTEVAATFLAAWVLYLCSLGRSSLLAGAVVGLAAGLGVLLRADLAVAMLLVPLAGMMARWQAGFRRPADVASALLVPAVVAAAPLCAVGYRNYRLVGEFRPLGPASSQMRTSYARWLDTWLDDPKYIHAAYWHVLNPGIEHPFIGSRLAPRDAAAAEAALVEARRMGTTAEGAYCGPPMTCFIRAFDGAPAAAFRELRARAVNDRPVMTLLVIPVKRALVTWLRLPSYFSQQWLKLSSYLFWLTLLAATLMGIGYAVQRRLWLLLPAAGLLLGRSVLPMLTAVGAEPRYMLEALPACYVFAGLACSVAAARFR